jgi:hypothetical protein
LVGLKSSVRKRVVFEMAVDSDLGTCTKINSQEGWAAGCARRPSFLGVYLFANALAVDENVAKVTPTGGGGAPTPRLSAFQIGAVRSIMGVRFMVSNILVCWVPDINEFIGMRKQRHASN